MSEIQGTTQLVGVFGWPVAHSLSPAMHNAAFAQQGLDWCYLPFAVAPEQLSQAVRGLRALGLRGANVTVPHKQAVMALMDELTPEARAVGAVNTIVVCEQGLLGHNTDIAGFRRTVDEDGIDVRARTVVVLGAGGAARAVVYALVQAGAKVMLLNRTVARAEALAQAMGIEVTAGVLDAVTLRQTLEGAALVVNTTPLGMWPVVDASPWPEDVPWPQGVPLFDLIYNPGETRLMALARRNGGICLDGLRMLVYQGAEAYALWTGSYPPVEVMYRAAALRLGR